jgi:hypothetical protein
MFFEGFCGFLVQITFKVIVKQVKTLFATNHFSAFRDENSSK